MYAPEINKIENQSEIDTFLVQNSFGILINQTNNKLWGTHIPFVYNKEENTLISHISKLNPQAQSIHNDDEVLCIFQGPNAYISSSWYDHENVPTWNYVAVHVYGKIRILNPTETFDSLKSMIDKYESTSEQPLKIENLSAKTMKQSNGIVAFCIEISEILGVNKMSQNRDETNKTRIINELEKTNLPDNIEIANLIKKQIK